MSTSFLQSRNGFYSQLRAWVPESDEQAELAAPSAELRGANAGEASKIPFSWIMAQAAGAPAATSSETVVAAAPATDPALRIDSPFAISLTGSGIPYTQNFDGLAQTGPSSTVPTDWAFSETGGTAPTTYSAGTGSGNGGDTWSFGVAGTNPVTDRAFGSLASNTVTQIIIGTSFTNNTGATIESMLISYVGEQWRRGGNTVGVADRLDFAISFNATSLTTGTWTDINSLDFVSVITTAATATLDGNNVANRIAISSNITSLAIANGATFWIRWVDTNIGGNDDGLAIDDFSLTPTTAAGNPGSLAIADASVTEGNSATTPMSFTVTRSGGTTGAVSANWTVFFSGNVGDASPSDLGGSLSGTVNFADGETSKTIVIDVNGDTDVEPNETFTVTLSGETGGVTISDANATGTINDDDAINVTINDVSIAEGNGGTSILTFTVTRTGGTGAFDVNFQTNDGSATAVSDYLSNSGTLNFGVGENSKTVQVTINGDTTSEPNETFTVTLSGATNGAVIADASGTGTINNDDFSLNFIHDIQGTAYWSPILAGDGITAYNTASTTTVTIRAVVTALDGVGSRQGFYLTEENADWDTNLFTSEGIFVMTRNDASVGQTLAAFSGTVQVGDIVTLTAQVMEYQVFSNMPRTVLVNASSIVIQSTANPLPTLTITSAPNSIMTAVTPDYTDSSDGAGDSFDASLYALSFWETVEGMLVTIPNMVVADGFVQTSGGRPYLQAYSTSLANPEQINSRGGYTIGGDPPNSPPNSANPNDGTTGGGAFIHDGDVNPDIIEVDFTDFAAAPPAGLTTGASMGDLLGDLTGIIDFDFTDRKLFVTSVGGTGFVDNGAPAQEVTSFGSDVRSLTVGTFNVENLDPGDGGARFTALANAIANNLKAPDIICIEEMQDNNGAAAGDGTSGTGTDAATTWQSLVNALNAATGKVYQWVDELPTYNAEGGEQSGNIRVGFLYDTGRVQLGDLAATATIAERRQYTDRIGDGVRSAGDLIAYDDSMLGGEINTADWTTTRKSLLGEFNFNGNKVYVTANHWPSKGGSGTFWQLNQDITTGNPTNSDWAQRNAIGQDVYAMLNHIQTNAANANIVAGGDFNEFYFNRPLEVVTGYVTTDGAARVGGSRFDNLMVTELTEAERYSYVFDGRSQGLDTILANARMSAIAGYDIVHINTGYNAGGTDPSLSDHEPSVATFDFRNYAESDGTAGADYIDGFGGADTMTGFGGNDIYIVDDAGDVIAEAAGGGLDTVFTSVTKTLQDDLERIGVNGFYTTYAINLTGNGVGNEMWGNEGANVLDGGADADIMYGFGGDDTYRVDNAGDIVIELANQGTDTVATTVSYTIAHDIEKLLVSDAASTGAINLTGNESANEITGNAGANLIDGGAGADTMTGLGGNDIYIVDNAGDVIVEAASAGLDTVFTTVSTTLGDNVDRLGVNGFYTTFAIDLTGNALDNEMWGNDGANILDGKAGADIIYGFAGADTFRFTTALGSGNVDQLVDFTAGTDTIALDDAVFTGLAAGALAAGAFRTGTAAPDADDRIIYDNLTGKLYFDADGNGSGAQVQFAVVHEGISLAASDFTVI